MAEKIDFGALASAALNSAERLLPDWVGGKKIRDEWHAGHRADGRPGDSLHINLGSGKWRHLATDDYGGDLISLYASLNGLSQYDAALAVAGELGIPIESPHPIRSTTPRPLPPPVDTPLPDLIPPDAPLPPAHPKLGMAAATYRYGDHFVIQRFEPADAPKQFLQLTWRSGRWAWKSWPSPRRLYGVEGLIERPDAPVLVVEGEKCQQAAHEALPSHVCLTWAAGAMAVKTADWTPLAGRTVTIWPDADDAGRKAAATLAGILLPQAASVTIAETGGAPEGWDIADAIAEKIDLIQWLAEHTKSIRPPSASPARAKPTVEPSIFVQWQECGLKCNKDGIPHPTESNVSLLLDHHENFRGKIWYDDFREQVWHTIYGEPAPWTDIETRALLQFMQHTLDLPKFNSAKVHEGVLMSAQRRRQNSVTRWLESVEWDGELRLDNWTVNYLGCPDDDHHRAAGRNWLISMVARAYQPGCQVDHVPVLESTQGAGKSTAVRIIGGEWFVPLTQGFGSKEFTEAIQGSWLVEIPDLAGFSKSQHQKVLADITKTNDRYRVPWDRLASNHHRRCVFAATTESSFDYLHDTFGTRRFWSLRCGRFDLLKLVADRAQLFAEATAAFKAHETWYVMPDQTTEEQSARVDQDLWFEPIRDFLDKIDEVTAIEVYDGCVQERDTYGGKRGAKATDTDKKRIAKTLRQLGWFPVALWRSNRKVNGWKRLPTART